MASRIMSNNCISDLLNTVSIGSDGKFVFNSEARMLVEEISKSAVRTQVFGKGKSFSEDFWKNFSPMTPDEVYRAMLSKISNAPTELHKVGIVILMIPKLNELLNKEKEVA